ncbi:hypothetical protein PT974_01907 [Cladobotryum mycophilum]|uniref:Uncharacterized protein n=1 Tax=Cladobotryum mycophilum TaxID=491253 RepID=A0ABR0SXR5_9HYPO
MPSQAQVIWAPARPSVEIKSKKSIFLAGTTTQTGEPDWREKLTEALSKYDITIFNPKRDDWDSSWKEDFSDSRWAEQVEWELEMQDKADIVVVFFHGISPAPISLLELGLCVRSGKAIVCALDSYSKRGNVEAVCRRYAAKFVSSMQELRDAVIRRLEQDGIVGNEGK